MESKQEKPRLFANHQQMTYGKNTLKALTQVWGLFQSGRITHVSGDVLTLTSILWTTKDS